MPTLVPELSSQGQGFQPNSISLVIRGILRIPPVRRVRLAGSGQIR